MTDARKNWRVHIPNNASNVFAETLDSCFLHVFAILSLIGLRKLTQLKFIRSCRWNENHGSCNGFNV